MAITLSIIGNSLSSLEIPQPLVTPKKFTPASREAGALFESQTRFLEILANHVVKDGRLVTGQNQNAGEEVAEIMMETAGGVPRKR